MSATTPGLDLPFLNRLLQPICGEPLSDMWRAVGQVFEFGKQIPAVNHKGEAITRGTFHLKFICADWRITQNGRIIMGSTDHDGDDRFYKSEEEPHTPYNAEARTLGLRFLEDVEAAKFVVETVGVGAYGDVTIRLTGGVVIESFASSGEDNDLWWCHDFRTDVSCLVGPSGYTVGSRTI